jgi:hypothetical protein
MMCKAAFSNRTACAAAALAISISAGCGSKSPRGVAEVPECRQSAASVARSSFDVGVDYLRRQADAYSECMTAHGYVLDQEELDEQIKHFEMVQNSQWMGGDPGPLAAAQRQKLRMSPKLWRPAPPLNS